MKQETWKEIWKECWERETIIGRVLLFLLTPYLWICFVLAGSKYEDNESEPR